MVNSVGVTGTRESLSVDQSHAFFGLVIAQIRLGATEVHHGACTGADEFMHLQMINMPGIWVHVHPPAIKTYQSVNLLRGVRVVWHEDLPYADRNQIIAERNVLIAAPQYPEDDSRSKRSGTWQTVRKAKAAGRLVQIANSDGTTWTYFDPDIETVKEK